MSRLNRRQRELVRHVDRIWTLDEFAKLNSISAATLARAIARGDGPKVVKLPLRRLGIRESDGAAWQAARIQERASQVPCHDRRPRACGRSSLNAGLARRSPRRRTVVAAALGHTQTA